MKNILWLCLTFLFFATNGFGQVKPAPALASPKIDGHIEKFWTDGTKFSNFRQIEPDIFADAAPAEITLGYDERNIYIAAVLV